MYFLEVLVKKLMNKKEQTDNYNPLSDQDNPDDDENCEHIFMPIDSSGEILSCRNCGLVVNRRKLKDINFFRKK